jgi:hypothetical protein
MPVGSVLCVLFSRPRSSFLHFAGFTGFHQVLDQKYGYAKRFANLIHGVDDADTIAEMQLTLEKHGIKKAAFQVTTHCNEPS